MSSFADNVTGRDVGQLCQRNDDMFIYGLGQVAADVAREAASAFTRGVGFEDAEQVPASLRHVILFRAVRVAQNYTQLVSEGRDGVTMSYGAAGQGWTPTEREALNEYRRTACSI